MAENQTDDAQKTEEATPKKLRDAHEKGQIARSQEVSHWFMIFAFTLTVAFFAPGVASDLSGTLVSFVAQPHAIPLDGAGVGEVLRRALTTLALALMAPIGVAVFAALLSGFIQSGVVLSLEPMKPKLSKISVLSGAKRMFSMRAIVEFAKGIVKIVIVTTAVGLVLWPKRDLIPVVPTLEMPQFMATMQDLGIRVLITVLSVVSVIAGLDYLFQRHKHMKEMRMSRQEIRDEYKQTEGDPMVKARLRQIRTERARQRMMAAVPEADVVIANPTHFAVALKYDPVQMGAPKLVAKGMDSLALRIRELAEELGIPVVENPPLARALHDDVDLDREVPAEHYKAVAQIIGYVWRLKGRKVPGAGP
jgi:flagellar biosynthetic protein FlhB